MILTELQQQIRDAMRSFAQGELAPEIDPAQLAFETNALLVAANLAYPLFTDPRILERAHVGIRERLRTAAIAKIPVLDDVRSGPQSSGGS